MLPQFEVQAIVNVAAGAASRAIYTESKSGSANPYLQLYLDSSERIGFQAMDDVGTLYHQAGGNTVISGWHMVGASYDGTTATVWVDKVAESTTLTLSGTYTLMDCTTIGAIKIVATQNFYNSYMGPVLYFSEPLTTAERLELYNSLKRDFTSLP